MFKGASVVSLCCLAFTFAAPTASSPMSQRDVRDAVVELRTAIGDAASFWARVRPEDINDEALFFEGQRQRMQGLCALARCVESINDSVQPSRDKALIAAGLRSLVSEMSGGSFASLEAAHRLGTALRASKSFDAYDRSHVRPNIGVAEVIVP
jgi:hypothetical protein